MSLNRPKSTFRQQEHDIVRQGWGQQQLIPTQTPLQCQPQQPVFQSKLSQLQYQLPQEMTQHNISSKKSRRGFYIVLGVIFALVLDATVAFYAILLISRQDTVQVTQHKSIIYKAQSQSDIGKAYFVDNTWAITISNVSSSYGNNNYTPGSNHVYIMIEVALKNISLKNQVVSHNQMFSFKTSDGQRYMSETVGFGSPPDGNVPPQSSLRGLLVYKVPTSQHQFVLGFQPDTSANTLKDWNITI